MPCLIRRSAHLRSGHTTSKASSLLSRRKSRSEVDKGLGQVPCLAVLLWSREVDEALPATLDNGSVGFLEVQSSMHSLTGADTEDAVLILDEDELDSEPAAVDMSESAPRPRVSILSPAGAVSSTNQSPDDADEAMPLKSALRPSKKPGKTRSNNQVFSESCPTWL